MIGIIIVTHGNLALELKSAMEHILGIQKNIDINSHQRWFCYRKTWHRQYKGRIRYHQRIERIEFNAKTN